MPYFSVKARAATQIAAELPRLPLTIVQPAYFYTNFLERFRPWYMNFLSCNSVLDETFAYWL